MHAHHHLRKQLDTAGRHLGGFSEATDGRGIIIPGETRFVAKLTGRREEPGGWYVYSWEPVSFTERVTPSGYRRVARADPQTGLYGTFDYLPAIEVSNLPVETPAVVELVRGPGEYYWFRCGCVGAGSGAGSGSSRVPGCCQCPTLPARIRMSYRFTFDFEDPCFFESIGPLESTLTVEHVETISDSWSDSLAGAAYADGYKCLWAGVMPHVEWSCLFQSIIGGPLERVTYFRLAPPDPYNVWLQSIYDGASSCWWRLTLLIIRGPIYPSTTPAAPSFEHFFTDHLAPSPYYVTTECDPFMLTSPIAPVTMYSGYGGNIFPCHCDPGTLPVLNRAYFDFIGTEDV